MTPREISAQDLWTFQKIGEQGTDWTGYPNISVYHDFRYHPKEVITGAMDDWLYDHLGIFAWGADNNVVRIYPNAAHPEVVVEPDRTVSFPLPGEQITIRSAPMPVAGNREDHEAFIVVASAAPINNRAAAEKNATLPADVSARAASKTLMACASCRKKKSQSNPPPSLDGRRGRCGPPPQ